MPDTDLVPPPHIHGAAVATWVAGERRRRQAAEDHAVAAACARLMVALAARLLNVPGPDAIRVLLGRQDALRVLGAAGHDVTALAGNWEATELVTRQASVTLDGYSGDPRHDPRVTELLLGGAGWAEINAVLGQVTAEAEQRAAGRADRERRQSGGPPVPMGASAGPDGVPQQRSTVMHDWSAFPDHHPAALATLAPRGCGHPEARAGKFCTQCGTPVPEGAAL